MIEIIELSFKYKGGSDYSLKDINFENQKRGMHSSVW